MVIRVSKSRIQSCVCVFLKFIFVETYEEVGFFYCGVVSQYSFVSFLRCDFGGVIYYVCLEGKSYIRDDRVIYFFKYYNIKKRGVLEVIYLK